jgi:hypothetical protein
MLIDDEKLKKDIIGKLIGKEYLDNRYVNGDDNIKTHLKTEVAIYVSDSSASSVCRLFNDVFSIATTHTGC